MSFVGMLAINVVCGTLISHRHRHRFSTFIYFPFGYFLFKYYTVLAASNRFKRVQNICERNGSDAVNGFDVNYRSTRSLFVSREKNSHRPLFYFKSHQFVNNGTFYVRLRSSVRRVRVRQTQYS